MQKRIGACLGVLAAATIHLALGVRPARACSPLAGKPCSAIDLIKPSASFPLNLVDEIQVAQRSFEGFSSTYPETFELSAPLTIARQSDGGYVEVAFELVTEPDLMPSARSVRLMDPLPGDYIVASVDDTCSVAPSPIGEGALIGSFSLTEAAAVPTVLGTAAWAGQELSTLTYSGEGIGGDCQPETVQAVVARNTIRVTLADEVLPWTGVLQTSLEVDGELYAGFGPAGDSTERELVVTIDHICPSDNPSFLEPSTNRLAEGDHTVKVIGRIRDFAPFESTEVAFNIQCGTGTGTGTGTATDTAGACSAAPGPRSTGNGPAWWALGAALLLRRARRVLGPR
jgi:hypothetical protein